MTPKIKALIIALVTFAACGLAFGQMNVQVESSGTALGRIKNVPNFKTANDIPSATSGTLTNPTISGTTTLAGQKRYLMSTFMVEERTLRFAVSSDGYNFNNFGGVMFKNSGTAAVSDPKTFWYNGKWWTCFTAGTFQINTNYFGLVSSPDLSNWTALPNIPMTGLVGIQSTWSPVPVLEYVGGKLIPYLTGTHQAVNIMVGAGTSTSTDGHSGMIPYVVTASNSELTAFSPPVAFTNSGTWPAKFIPNSLIVMSGTFHLFANEKVSASSGLQHYTAPALTGPYTIQQTYTGSGYEGWTMVPEGTGWRVFFDRYLYGGLYTATLDASLSTLSAASLVPGLSHRNNNPGVLVVDDLDRIQAIDKAVAVGKRYIGQGNGAFEPAAVAYGVTFGAKIESGFRAGLMMSNIQQEGGEGGTSFALQDPTRSGLMYFQDFVAATRHSWWSSAIGGAPRLVMSLTGTNNNSGALFVDGSGTFNRDMIVGRNLQYSGTLVISGTTAAPSGTAAPVTWFNGVISGTTYKIPLYQ